MLEAEAFTSFKLSYSKSVNTFKELPASYKDSILAMNIGNTFNSNGRIYCYDDLGLGRLLYNIPGEEVEAYLNKHINIDLLSQIDEETLNLLESFFANDLSLAETSRKMFIHRNTLIYRLDKFADLTGYDVRKFSDAITVKISLMLYNYINSQKQEPKMAPIFRSIYLNNTLLRTASKYSWRPEPGNSGFFILSA